MNHRLVPVLTLLTLAGCPKPVSPACESTSLDAALARAEAASDAAGRTRAVADALAAACPDVPPPPSLATGDAHPICAHDVNDLQAVWDACAPEPLGPPAEFVWADGDPRLATVLLSWMTENGVDAGTAARTARVVRGKPLYVPPASGAPSLPAGLAGPAPTAAVTWTASPEALTGSSVGWKDGRFTDESGVAGVRFGAWAVPGVAPAEGVVAAVDGRVPLETLRRLVASLGAPVTLLGTGPTGGPATLRVVPTASEEPAGLGPDATVADLVGAAAGQPSVSLALDGDRCRPGPVGMVCVAGTTGRSTFWIDPQPATVDEWDACRKAGVCRGGGRTEKGAVTGLKYDDARQLCQHLGKRLPTETELAAAPPSPIATWSGTTTTAKGEQPCELAQCRTNSHAVVWRSGARAVELRAAAVADAGVRCATGHPFTTALPARVVTHPLPARSLPAPPTEEQRRLAWDFERDPIEDKGVCGNRDIKLGGAGLACRDPLSYVTPNENRDLVWRPYVENLGGAYVGVGSDQGYNFCAVMKCEWAWLMDYDPNVVRAHQVILALIEKSETPQQFAERFAAASGKETEAILREKYAKDPGVDKIVEFYYGYRPKMHEWYAWRLIPYPEDPKWGWLANPDQFQYIRQMVAQGRMVPVAGDMLGKKSMTAIGDAARALGVPIHVYYTSNAPTAWGGQLTPEYRANVRGLPMDEGSIVAETHYMGDRPGDNWRYTTIGGLLMQDRLALPSYQRAHELEWDRLSTPIVDFSVLGLTGP